MFAVSEVNIRRDREQIDVLFHLFCAWPLSVSPSYPVPSPETVTYALYVNNKADRAYYAYMECKTGADFWTGEYGALRRQLLDFCIKELSNGF